MRITIILITLFFFLAPTQDACAEKNARLAVSKIPDSLMKNADAVIRDYQLHVEIVSLDEINVIESYTVTVLNKDAHTFSVVNELYDNFSEVGSIHGTLYDKNGDEVKELKKQDIDNVGFPFVGMHLYNDKKLKHYDFNYHSYPYTVSFEINKTLKESYGLPRFIPQKSRNCAVEKASIELLYPKTVTIRYKTFHLSDKPVLSADGNDNKLTLAVAGIKAEKETELLPQDGFPLPEMVAATDNFLYAGIPGKMDTWKSFGKFVYDLNANRNNLTPEMKRTVHQLTDTCTSSFSKINTLYEHLQKSTRYIAIQEGISGMQCFDAKDVCENKYADCKGLSNYMGAMLKEAGIKSLGVLITGEANYHQQLDAAFPMHSFNHYILCVPQERDTLWMDCTSKTDPVGYLATFTSDRDALLLTQDGGYIVHSPAYGIKENTASRNATTHITAGDEQETVLKLHYTGASNDAESYHVIDKPKDKIEAHFAEKFPMPQVKVASYKIAQGKNGYIPTLSEDVVLKGTGMVSRTGKRVFVEPGILRLRLPVPSNTEPRTSPFEIGSSSSVTDTETITIDGAYTKEYLPENIDISQPFGSYSCRVFFEQDNVIKIIRAYTQRQGVYPPDLFTAYYQMTKEINTNLKQAVLVKK